MDGARLEVALEPHPEGFGATGAESVELRVATNPGMPVSPLRDAASGGELSRIMLALTGLAGADARRDARLRRDRRRRRRQHCAGGRRAPARARRGPPGPLHHPPAAGRLAGDDALPDREGRRGGEAAARGRARSRATSWSPRSSGCSAPSAATRPPAATPSELLRPPSARRASWLAAPRSARDGLRAAGRRALLRGPEIQLEPPPVAPIDGRARLGRKTKDLVKRLGPGDIAVIDHADLDRIAAEDLVATGVRGGGQRRAVLDRPLPERRARWFWPAPASPWSTPRRRRLFDELADGDESAIDGGEVRRDGELLATGALIDLDELRPRRSSASASASTRRSPTSPQNTIEHVREEGELLAGTIDFPRDAHRVPRPPRPDRRPGHHLPRGPAHAARLHPRRPAGAGRRRRRRRRDPRGGLRSPT